MRGCSPEPGKPLRIVGPTLTQSAGFETLSGASLYATLTRAPPLHMALMAQALSARARRALRRAA